ncbi:hypothetical protein [Salinispora sp. H7-4]|uniref:hypothetical protein n=1 Tax=Salinispora sp. H7-4 TaxID=2748321 RepID=UPI0015D2401A|nr:hypothetical protein [Salinispora sp. H7-4]NYT92356.1 hypothetical protein [Salinispora sp. H7-4]
MLATARWLEATATDNALELLNVFMANELVGRAERNAAKAVVKRASGQARHARPFEGDRPPLAFR